MILTMEAALPEGKGNPGGLCSKAHQHPNIPRTNRGELTSGASYSRSPWRNLHSYLAGHRFWSHLWHISEFCGYGRIPSGGSLYTGNDSMPSEGMGFCQQTTYFCERQNKVEWGVTHRPVVF